MTPDDVHKILVPYLWAAGLLIAILVIGALLAKRDGDREKDEERRRGQS